MRPPAPAVLGLLLLLLPTGEATKKPTPCKRCRELVDKFNQVGRSLRGDGGGGRGLPAMAQNYPTVDLRSPCRGLGRPPWPVVTYCGLWSPHCGLGHPIMDWVTPPGLGHPTVAWVTPMDWINPHGLGHPHGLDHPIMDWVPTVDWVTLMDWVTPHGLGHPTMDWVAPIDWVTPHGLGRYPWTGSPPWTGSSPVD